MSTKHQSFVCPVNSSSEASVGNHGTNFYHQTFVVSFFFSNDSCTIRKITNPKNVYTYSKCGNTMCIFIIWLYLYNIAYNILYEQIFIML